MILDVYFIFLLMALALLFYGWYVKADLYRIIGTLLLFLLGSMLLPGVPNLIGFLEVPTGATITQVGGVSTVLYTYTNYQSHTIGYFLTLSAILSLVLIMVDRRAEGQK